MPRLEGVLFDLDGTLLDSAPDIRQALNLLLQAEGRPSVTLDQVKSMVGDGVMELCRRALLATGGVMADDLYPYVQKFIGYYRNIRPDPQQIYPGVREILEELSKAGVKLAVCTNKPESATVKILDELDLSRYFAFIAGGDTFTVHKPNPGHVTQILDILEILPQDTLFVGDGPNDVLASRAAGVTCIVVTHGYEEDYGSLGADKLIPNFAALRDMIRELGFTY